MSHRPKEDVEDTIFVGNLPKEISTKELKKLFRKFGPIINLRLRCAIRKDLKIPRKQAVIKKDFHEESDHINAFIKFQSFKSCKKALKMNGELHGGHHLRVTLAKDTGKSDPRKSVFIGNLPYKAEDDVLWNAFEDCGTIDSVRVVRDEKTGIGKGFGYVNFKSADSVELALKLNGVMVLDRNIRVSRVTNDMRSSKEITKKRVQRKAILKRMNNTKLEESEKDDGKIKTKEKVKVKHEYQGKKTKLPQHKKNKKKKKFDKKKMFIKQIAQSLTKKK